MSCATTWRPGHCEYATSLALYMYACLVSSHVPFSIGIGCYLRSLSHMPCITFLLLIVDQSHYLHFHINVPGPL